MPEMYPVHLNLKDRLCLVVGGGIIGARKAIGLKAAGAKVRVVSLEFCDSLRSCSNELELIEAAYCSEHLDGAFLAVTATDNRQVNAAVVCDAQDRRILVNCADNQQDGDFIVPASLHRGDLCISVSTGSASPGLSKRIKRDLELQFGDEFADYVKILGEMRDLLKAASKPEQSSIESAMAALLDSQVSLLSLLRSDGYLAARHAALQLIERLPE